MAKKTQDIKTYLATIGKTEQLHLFVGNTNTTVANNSEDSTKDLWKNMIFTKRMSREDVVGVIPNITWTSGNVYYPWSSTNINSGAYYAWNKENGNVYLCLENTDMNRIDLSGQISSTYAPTHSYGIQKYADGYTWLPIYRITPDYLRFVKNEWIPIISFEDYEETGFSTEFAAGNYFCNDNFDTSGYCSLYFKNNTSLQTSGITYELYLKGDLYTTLPMLCSECYYMYKDSNTFQNVFNIESTDVASSIPIYDKLSLIGKKIENNELSPSSAFYALYQIAVNGPLDGAILSATIDLSGFSDQDLIVSEPNPYLTVSSFSGSGATIRFKTINTITGKYAIQGIEVIETGSGYREASLDIDASIFQNYDIKDFILSAIQMNIDIIDGLNVDPYDVLNCANTMVDARIDTSDLTAQKISLPSTINFYGLVSNPLEMTDTGDYIVSGSELPKNATKLKTGLTELGIISVNDIYTPLDPPTVIADTGNVIVSDILGEQISDSQIIKSSLDTPEPIIALPNESFINVIGYNYSNIAQSTSLLDSANNEFTINRIVKEPDLKQFSGKVLTTKKTTSDIKLASGNGTNSKIIRINIIRGL